MESPGFKSFTSRAKVCSGLNQLMLLRTGRGSLRVKVTKTRPVNGLARTALSIDTSKVTGAASCAGAGAAKKRTIQLAVNNRGIWHSLMFERDQTAACIVRRNRQSDKG